jgi:hypothetical protein
LASPILDIKVFRDVVTYRLVATDHWKDGDAYQTRQLFTQRQRVTPQKS